LIEEEVEYVCECCGLNEAQVKDYREDERTGTLEEYFVCYNCMNLNNYWFYKLMETETIIGKKRIISQIVGEKGGWRKYLIKNK